MGRDLATFTPLFGWAVVGRWDALPVAGKPTHAERYTNAPTDETEREANTGKFRHPRDQRHLSSVGIVVDHWLYSDPVADAIGDVHALYREY